MSGSVVIELQRDALDRNFSATDLLRKALVVARKLKIPELEQWINKELSGFGDNEVLPEYRIISGQVRGWNPYHGWQPIYFPDAEMEEALSKRGNSQTIAEIESLINNKKESGSLQIPFTGSIHRQLCNAIGQTTDITLIVQPQALVRIIDAVRTIILNWALQLEEDGILGEGLAFTVAEKQEVGKNSYNVNNFYGSINSSQIAQGNTHSSQVMSVKGCQPEELTKFINALKLAVPNLQTSDDEKAEVSAEIATIEAQVQSPKPKPGIIREGLKSIRTILEGAGGDIVAPLLIQLGKLLVGGS